jgi:threonine synthase
VAAAGLSRLLRQGDIADDQRVVLVATGSGLKASDRIHSLLQGARGHCNEE